MKQSDCWGLAAVIFSSQAMPKEACLVFGFIALVIQVVSVVREAK